MTQTDPQTETAAGATEPRSEPSKPWYIRFAPVFVVLGGLAAAYAAGLHQYLSLETLRDSREALTGFVAANPLLAVAAFVLIYAVATLFMVPGALWLTIGGGFMFGLLGGGALTVLGATLGATALFLIARTSFGEGLKRRAGPWLKKMRKGFEENPRAYMFAMRFFPAVPFPVANIAPALLGAKLPDYMLTTAVGVIPGVLAYSWIGAGLGAAFDQGETPDLAAFGTSLLPAFLALAAVSLAPVLWRRFGPKKAAATDA